MTNALRAHIWWRCLVHSARAHRRQVATGTEAIEAIEREKPDLALLDLQMHGWTASAWCVY
ncbi:MAG: hypothetical protein WKF30_10610 [Pyrinomonadaceae bacterium]